MEKHSAEEVYELYRKHRTVCTDTRKIVPGSIFFALKGDNFDANAFAAEALEKGCAFAVVDNPKYAKGEGCILVDDVLKTLQKTAVLHRRRSMIPFIGITGTNGKTTTKELVKSVLGVRYKVYATEGNLNNHIGVPLTILAMPQDTEIAVIEMGANHPGEIAELCRIALPTFGLITNIGQAHLEGFGSFANIVNTKTALYEFVKKVHGKVFVNADNSILMNASCDVERFCYGSRENVFLRMTHLEEEQVKYTCCLHGTPSAPNITKIESNLIGKYNLENLAAAACVGRYFSLNDQEIKEGLDRYQPTNYRSQGIQVGKNVIIADAYNANPTSMEAALENFAEMHFSATKLPILGDMLELGSVSKEEHQKVVDLLQKLKFDTVYLVGENFAKTNRPQNYRSFAKAEDLNDFLSENPLNMHCLLVKGSHGVHLEKVIDMLKKQAPK